MVGVRATLSIRVRFRSERHVRLLQPVRRQGRILEEQDGPSDIVRGPSDRDLGESLAFRVGDVINPQDFSWNFGFANLEQSRLPLWMVHPILNLPSYGPFNSNFVEGIWTPAWQPMYTQVDTPNQDANPHSNWYDGQHDVAGSISVQAPFTLTGRHGFRSNPTRCCSGRPGCRPT